MLWRTALLTLMLAGCGQNKTPEPQVLHAEPIQRQLYLPTSDTLPEQLRGKRVFLLGSSASAHELTYRIIECKWLKPGLAVVEWSVTNTGQVPVVPPRLAILSVDGLSTKMFTEQKGGSEFNHEDAINPSLSRSGKSRFELPPQGKFVIGADSPTTGDVVLFDCDLDQHAYVTVDQ